MPLDDNMQINKTLAGIDELVRKVELLKDPSARAMAVDLVRAVMELHSTTVGRMLEIVAAQPGGTQAIAALASDQIVSSVLAMHGLHPDDVETRARRAIETLRRGLDPRGTDINLVAVDLSLDSSMVRVRVTSSRQVESAALKQLIEETLWEAAPELATIVIEGMEDMRKPGFVPLSDLVSAVRE